MCIRDRYRQVTDTLMVNLFQYLGDEQKKLEQRILSEIQSRESEFTIHIGVTEPDLYDARDVYKRQTMPKEITGFTNSIKDQINRKNFGWIFASENAALDGMNTVSYTHLDVYKRQIFPNLSISLQAGAKLRRERFAGNVHKVNEDVNSLETLSTLLDVLKDYRVETFFSFETREETTFNAVAAEGIQKFIDRCEPLVGKPYSEFAIPCLPNFTVIRCV